MIDSTRFPVAMIDVIRCDMVVDDGIIDWSIEIPIHGAIFPVGGMFLCGISTRGVPSFLL